MDEQTKGFRSAVFGGFRREDVLRYIEETDAKYYEESERLRSSLDDAQTAMGELRGQNEKLTEKNAELLERLGAMTLDMDRIQAQLDEIEKGFSLQTTEIEAQNERAETLAAENDRLTSENAKLPRRNAASMTSPRTRSRRWSFRPTAAPSRSRRTQKPSFRSCAASRSRPSSRCAVSSRRPRKTTA